jgi:hypothetical protein
MRTARRAGGHAAARAPARRKADAARRTTGSRGVTPKSIDSTRRPASTDASSPTPARTSAPSFDDRYFDGYAGKVRATTLADAKGAAEVVQPDKLVWVIAGDRAKIEPALKELGLGEVKAIDADGNVI